MLRKYKIIRQEMLKQLKEIPFFSELEEYQLVELSRISTLQHYTEGEVFACKGDMLEHLIILVDGIVSVYKNDKKGNEIVIGYFHRYAMLLEPPTLMHENSFSSGKFKSAGALVKIELEVFEEYFMQIPSISKAVINSLLKKIKLLQQNIHLNINATAADKVIYFYKYNRTLSVDLKKYEIASLLGISPETYSRIVSSLVEENKLVVIASGYKLVD